MKEKPAPEKMDNLLLEVEDKEVEVKEGMRQGHEIAKGIWRGSTVIIKYLGWMNLKDIFRLLPEMRLMNVFPSPHLV